MSSWVFVAVPYRILVKYVEEFRTKHGNTSIPQIPPDRIKHICQGKSECHIEPTRELFSPLTCTNFPRMWLTYSCDGGTDISSGLSYKPFNCPAESGKMNSRDIPLDNGHINIKCRPRNGVKPCIYIHKVLAACSGHAARSESQSRLVSVIVRF